MNIGRMLSAACGNYVVMMVGVLLALCFLFQPFLHVLGAVLVFFNNLGNG